MTLRPVMFIVADKNMEYMFRGFLERPNAHLSLACGAFDFQPAHDLISAPDHDPGLYAKAGGYARGASRSHARLVIALDAEWEGSPGAVKIATHVGRECQQVGWDPEHVCAVVIDPEIENWVWQDNPNVQAAVGHQGPKTLRRLLAEDGTWPEDASKPHRPKETLEAVLRRNRVPRSSGLYRKIAGRVTVKGCTDPAFRSLVAAMQRWFPP
jgi:hypothetical protein